MTVSNTEMQRFALDRIAFGHVVSFGRPAVGDVLEFNLSFTYSTPSLNGQWVRVRPVSASFSAGQARDGLIDLPGGGIFDPWGAAYERGPITFPTISQRLIYNGNKLPVHLELEKLMRFVNVTSNLTISRGLTWAGEYGNKTCPAKLLTLGLTIERPFQAGSTTLTWVEINPVWRQVGVFQP